MVPDEMGVVVPGQVPALGAAPLAAVQALEVMASAAVPGQGSG